MKTFAKFSFIPALMFCTTFVFGGNSVPTTNKGMQYKIKIAKMSKFEACDIYVTVRREGGRVTVYKKHYDVCPL
jgi:hypothetical protein